MFKTLKDTKRRMVESVLEGVGKSEKTVDEEFDMYYAKYQSMMADLNECGAGLHTVLSRQKEFFRDLSEMANSVSRINQTNNDPEYWKGSTNCLTAVEGAELNKESAEYIHNVVRSSCALSVVENALDPLRDAIATITPEIDGLVKDRNAQVIDYDSYRRRVKGIREKKEGMETQGKTGTPAYAETQQELAKFEGKEQVAKEGYEFKNGNTKEKILDARVRHDVLLNDLLVNLVVAQHEMYSRAAAEMERVISRLPEDKVAEALARITETIKKGGNKPEAPKEKSSLAKGLAIVTGKAVPSDFKKATPADAEVVKSPSNAASPPVAVPVGGPSGPSGTALPTATKVGGTTATSPVKSSSNPFGGSSPVPPAGRPAGAVPPPPPTSAVPPPPPASAGPPPPSSSKTYFVEALYDIEAEAEDELTFKAGDSIEVLETSDDGWWKGRINGKEGLFPVNYVRT